MKKACIDCDLIQVSKISNILSLNKNVEIALFNHVQKYLKSVDKSKTNPEVMGEVWQIITDTINNDNPYKEIKKFYNQALLKLSDEINEIIDKSTDKFNTALKISIIGNLIDFNAKHEFNLADLKDRIKDSLETILTIDDSKQLKEALLSAKTLLYLGDNCGEICLDKLFIKQIKKDYPNLTIYFGVRGKAIVNDVTCEDAKMVKMAEVAKVISNGDGSLGTVLEKTSQEFQNVFSLADVVISKGQGNYEGLLSNDKDKLFFLFMAKCDVIARPLKIASLSIVCKKNNEENHNER